MESENWLDRLRTVRGGKWMLLLAAVGLGLLLLSGLPPKESAKIRNTEDTEEYFSVRFYTETLEQRIAELCSEVRGVSDAHVLLTLEGGSEYLYAENIAGAARNYLLAQEEAGESPLLLQEIYPRIRGVAVVCRGGDSTAVQLTLTELLSAALGIPASRIQVAGS